MTELSPHRGEGIPSQKQRLLGVASPHSPEGELPGLQVDLVDELPSGGHDDALGLLQLSETAGGDAVTHHLRQDRQEKRCLQVKWHSLQIARHPLSPSIILV